MITVVSRAFQILSDSDKKSRYDKFGGDPDSRFSASGAGAGPSAAGNPFGGFGGGGFPQSRAGGGPMFEEEISPEELFNRFFGGGFGGGGFGGPFGGKISYKDEAVLKYTDCHHRRSSICLQYGRWSRIQGSPIRRPRCSQKAS